MGSVEFSLGFVSPTAAFTKGYLNNDESVVIYTYYQCCIFLFQSLVLLT